MAKAERPYIPREYYPAVRFACKMLRETGWYNKSISKAASYYDIDEDELKEWVNKWTHAKPRASGYKMKWFLVQMEISCEANSYCGDVRLEIVKGKSKDTVENRLADIEWKFDRRNDTGSSYSRTMLSGVIGEYDTEEDAKTAMIERRRVVDEIVKRGGDVWSH